MNTALLNSMRMTGLADAAKLDESAVSALLSMHQTAISGGINGGTKMARVLGEQRSVVVSRWLIEP